MSEFKGVTASIGKAWEKYKELPPLPRKLIGGAAIFVGAVCALNIITAGAAFLFKSTLAIGLLIGADIAVSKYMTRNTEETPEETPKSKSTATETPASAKAPGPTLDSKAPDVGSQFNAAQPKASEAPEATPTPAPAPVQAPRPPA